MTKRQMYIKLVVSSLIRRKARMIVALLENTRFRNEETKNIVSLQDNLNT